MRCAALSGAIEVGIRRGGQYLNLRRAPAPHPSPLPGGERALQPCRWWSEILLQAQVHAAARPELRRAHADAAAVAQLVAAVERVDHRQLRVQVAEAVEAEV